jgi:TP901 family phage tail tape measure protein
MSRLTATMVVDLTDKTGGKTRAIIGNLDRLKRAERDYMLADKGLRLSNRDRAMERVLMAREAEIADRQQMMAAWGARAGAAVAAGGYMAAKAYGNYADLERRINRIVINADKGAQAIKPTMDTLRAVADDAKLPFQQVVEGFEALVASGRSLEESLAFLPSVATTAQASGAALTDIALSADSLAGSMNIDPSQMQKAFDILVAGGKAGKFELKDMAQHLPSLLPAFAALGYEGTEGLQKMVAMLQTVRNQAGSSSEAATYLGNVFNKMYSEETANKFKKNFDIDLPAALAKAKAEGKDVLDVFLDMTELATKGDLSRLTLLFTDSELQKGVRALLTQRDALESMNKSLANVDGSTLKDFNQIVSDSEAKVQALANNFDRFVTNVGKLAAMPLNPVLETFNEAISEAEAKGNYQKARDRVTIGEERERFDAMYRELNPDAWRREINQAYTDAVSRVGRGQAATIFDELNTEIGRRRGGEIMDRLLTGSGGRDTGTQGLGAGAARNRAPIPRSRGEASEASLSLAPLPSDPGRYASTVSAELALDAARRGRAIGLGGSTDTLPGKLADDLGIGEKGPRAVKIEGTPQVTITNPPPRPNVNVNMSVIIQEAPNADAVANQLRDRIQSELNGMQGPLEYGGL